MNFPYRLDFGFGNPNVAGAFFAVFALAVFLPSFRVRGLVFLQLVISMTSVAAVFLTASRGALIGLALGGLCIWTASGFPRPKVRVVVICGSILLLLFVLLGVRSAQRMSKLGPADGSIASRLEIYKCIPSMIVAAPWGWGKGEAATAYENWFQPVDDTTHFKNLLSTHGTWAVEYGIPFLACYLIMWGFAFWVSSPISLGVLACWAICCSFSHVGGVWWMWILPMAAVVFSVFERSKRGIWPERHRTVGVVLGVLLTFSAVFTVGLWMPVTHGLSFDGKVLRLGTPPYSLWFFFPDVSVMGKTYGKELRSLGSIAVAKNWNEIQNPEVLVLSGNATLPTTPRAFEKLVWINPPPTLDPNLMQVVVNSRHKLFLWGALRNDASSAALQQEIESLPDVQWQFLPGRGRYVGDSLKGLNQK